MGDKPKTDPVNPPQDDFYDGQSLEMEEMLYARHVEIKNMEEMTIQRGTPIPALFNNFYKFIQNPSSISIETFKRMIDTDDTVGAGVDFLTTCLAARIGRYQHKSKEVTEWVSDRLEDIEGGWHNKIKEILSATWAGFFCGEKIWANTENGFVIEKIAPLPPTTVLFEVDRTGTLTKDGVLQYQRNWSPFGLSSGLGYFGGVMGGSGFLNIPATPDPFAKLGDLPFPMRTANSYNYLSIRIPKQKVVHYAFDAQGKFDNPYGRSLLRRCYKHWVSKDATLRMSMTALDRKGTPMLCVWVDPNTTLKDPRKVNPAGNSRGRAVGENAQEQIARVFKNPHNDSVFILPGKKDQYVAVQPISQDYDASAFQAQLDGCDKRILRSLLIPALIFGSGDGSGSFALGQEHGRTFDKILDGINSGLIQVILQQIVKELIAYNFPRSAWQKDGLGDFTQRELTTEERQKEMEVVEKAVNLGAVDMNDLEDLNEVRQKAGFSETEELIPQKDIFGMEEEGLIGSKAPGGEAEEEAPAPEEKKPSKNPKRKGLSKTKKGKK